MAFIEASKTGSKGGGDGVPVGALMTFSGEELPEGYEPAETEEQISIQQLNDNLSGFKFYPTGTGIVGLIADDSAYTDANGKYVIWGTATANQLVADNPNTYKSVPSEEETHGEVGADTCSPFKSSGELELANSDKWTGSGLTLQASYFTITDSNTITYDEKVSISNDCTLKLVSRHYTTGTSESISIEVSEDKTTWTNIATFSGLGGGSPITIYSSKTISIGNVSKYIRLIYNDNSSTSRTVNILSLIFSTHKTT